MNKNLKTALGRTANIFLILFLAVSCGRDPHSVAIPSNPKDWDSNEFRATFEKLPTDERRLLSGYLDIYLRRHPKTQFYSGPRTIGAVIESERGKNRAALASNAEAAQSAGTAAAVERLYRSVEEANAADEEEERRNEDAHHKKLLEAVISGDEKAVKELAREAPFSSLSAALWRASAYRNLAIIETLLAEGASPNSKDEDGWTPLMLAAYSDKGEVEALEFLIKAGANIDAQDSEGSTPLMWAAKGNRVKAAKILMDAGASKTTRNGDGETALDVAKKMGAELTIALLNKNASKLTKNVSPPIKERTEAEEREAAKRREEYFKMTAKTKENLEITDEEIKEAGKLRAAEEIKASETDADAQAIIEALEAKYGTGLEKLKLQPSPSREDASRGKEGEKIGEEPNG